jgi:protocatechuate 3,4-dioxygenase beta subunit
VQHKNDLAVRSPRWTRRKFIKMALLTGGIPFLAACDALLRYESALNSESAPLESTTILRQVYPPILELAAEDEPGEQLIISGAIYDDTSTPLAGAIMTLWHTDANGEYGRFEGGVQTDQHGRYEIRTIRPGNYQVEDITRAAHIHFTLAALNVLPQSGELLFADDPLLTTDPVVLDVNPDVVAARTLTLSVEQDDTGSYSRAEHNFILQSR